MAEWFEVYNAKGVLLRAQRRTRRLVLVFALVSAAVVVVAPLATFALPTAGFAVALASGAALVGYGIWLIARLSAIHGTLWRLDLSVHRALGFDTGRRARILAWPDVHHVDVADAGITIVGRTHGAWVRLHVPRSFPRYVTLAHRVVEYARAHRRPLWLDGRPLEAVDLSEVHALASAGSADRGSRRGPRTAA